jgi:hypothetical protein
MRAKPRILSVRIERAVDDWPDTSYLGRYSDKAETEWAIDRQERGDWGRGEYRYWNPGANHIPPGDVKSWTHVSDSAIAEACKRNGVDLRQERDEAIRLLDLHYIEEDCERCESLNRGNWCYLGIIAKAKVVLADGVVQAIRSGGLWGIESDSGEDYLSGVEKDELANLRKQLEAVGFGKRAIDYAFRNVEREE